MHIIYEGHICIVCSTVHMYIHIHMLHIHVVCICEACSMYVLYATVLHVCVYSCPWYAKIYMYVHVPEYQYV